MIGLLNLVPVLLLVVSGIIWWQWAYHKDPDVRLKRTVFVLFWFIFCMIMYMTFQPSYMPKGTVNRTAIPAFEHSEAQIQDRMLRTDPEASKENVRKMHESFVKEGTQKLQ